MAVKAFFRKLIDHSGDDVLPVTTTSAVCVNDNGETIDGLTIDEADLINNVPGKNSIAGAILLKTLYSKLSSFVASISTALLGGRDGNGAGGVNVGDVKSPDLISAIIKESAEGNFEDGATSVKVDNVLHVPTTVSEECEIEDGWYTSTDTSDLYAKAVNDAMSGELRSRKYDNGGMGYTTLSTVQFNLSEYINKPYFTYIVSCHVENSGEVSTVDRMQNSYRVDVGFTDYTQFTPMHHEIDGNGVLTVVENQSTFTMVRTIDKYGAVAPLVENLTLFYRYEVTVFYYE